MLEGKGDKRLSNLELSNLITRVSKNEIEALEKLYKKTSHAVFGFALSILKDYMKAEDIMQDVYVKIFEKAHTFKRGKNARAWILTITRNLCFMEFRKKENKNVSIEEFYNLQAMRDDFGVLEKRLYLARLSENLSPEEIQIVAMRSLWGLKHKEVAKLLDMPLSTAIAKYNRALKKMKKQREVIKDEEWNNWKRN